MKTIIETVASVIFIILFLTLALSVVNALGTERGETCKTKGYYLPITYLICKINEPRETP